MQIVPLQPIPKQNLQISLGGNLYDLDLLATAGCMSMDVTRGTTLVAQGQRVVAGQLCLPYRTMEAEQGNFLFLTANDELPSYVSFGISQFLIYASNAELAAVRASPAIVLATLMAMATMQGAATVRFVT